MSRSPAIDVSELHNFHRNETTVPFKAIENADGRSLRPKNGEMLGQK